MSNLKEVKLKEIELENRKLDLKEQNCARIFLIIELLLKRIIPLLTICITLYYCILAVVGKETVFLANIKSNLGVNIKFDKALIWIFCLIIFLLLILFSLFGYLSSLFKKNTLAINEDNITD